MGILSAIGSVIGMGANYLMSKKQMDKQDQYVLNGVTYKARDAMNAYKETGIHPLIGMGANTMSYSPVAVGDMTAPMENLGQNLERARQATSTDAGRVASGAERVLVLEGLGLDNEMKRTQIASERARLTGAGIGPPMPGLVDEKLVDPQRTRGVNAGIGLKSNPYFSDAQTYEDRYGELGGSILGLGNIPADLYEKLKPYLDRLQKADYSTHRTGPNRGYPRYGGGR